MVYEWFLQSEKLSLIMKLSSLEVFINNRKIAALGEIYRKIN